jgi:hypothetical protein
MSGTECDSLLIAESSLNLKNHIPGLSIKGIDKVVNDSECSLLDNVRGCRTDVRTVVSFIKH